MNVLELSTKVVLILKIINVDLSKYRVVEVHISTIKNGDTILHTDNKITTVCNNNIKTGFCGITLFGDSYRSGRLLVKKIII